MRKWKEQRVGPKLSGRRQVGTSGRRCLSSLSVCWFDGLGRGDGERGEERKNKRGGGNELKCIKYRA